jgi:murein DD-endopeptidase MepM/ murein hydrolase activator NlpD
LDVEGSDDFTHRPATPGTRDNEQMGCGALVVTRTFAVAVLAAGGLTACASSTATRQDTIPTDWPVNPKQASVSAAFGPRGNGSWHQGIDLSAPKGTPVRATADGRVVVAERKGAWGRMVLIDHGNGYETRFAHLKRIKVERGEKVRRGEVVGTVGESGNATGPHLHYEVLISGTPVDPRPFMDGTPPPP